MGLPMKCGRVCVYLPTARGDEDVDAKRSRPSIGKPASGHAKKERASLFGTDQRITSGPAARRPRSKAGYMTAPVSFRERSDSFPLHGGRRPYMTLSRPTVSASELTGRIALNPGYVIV